MLICKECGQVYDENEELPTRVDDFGFETGVGFKSYPQEFVECYCGGELEEAGQCAECGEWFCEDDLELDDDCDYFCKKCYAKLEAEDDSD